MLLPNEKAITFSYDDGVLQDFRLVELLNKYGIKATFNINSELLGTERVLTINGKPIQHNKISRCDVAPLYRGHEVAVHTLTHPHLTTLSDEEIIRQVERDRENLSDLVGYEVVGMAYPGGGYQNSDRVERAIRAHTGVKYARTISLGYSFEPQENLFRYKPTAYHIDYDVNYLIADEFFSMDRGGLLYIWGHSYEFDINDTWAEFEKFLAYISGRDGIKYITNKEALL